MIRVAMLENLDGFKTRAVQNRNKGRHTGKSAAGWNAKRGEHEKGSWDHFHTVAMVRFQAVASQAQEAYRRAVFPERYEDDVTLDDLIAANEAAARDSLLATF